ncbi:MAG: hypothetical protein ACPGJV_14360, partial [Bacteriovoracaceae bacterium]
MKFLTLAILCLFSAFSEASLKVAISSAPNNISPFSATDSNSQNLGRLLFVSLIDFNREMQPICMACETYSERIEK